MFLEGRRTWLQFKQDFNAPEQVHLPFKANHLAIKCKNIKRKSEKQKPKLNVVEGSCDSARTLTKAKRNALKRKHGHKVDPEMTVSS